MTNAVLAVLSIGTAIYLVSVRVTRELENSLQREIRSTGFLVEQLRTTRAQTFATMAHLIADAPKLKAAVDTGDPPTVQDNANDYQAQVNSNLLLVTSRTGRVLATVGASASAATAVAAQASVRNAIAGHEGVSLIPQADGILHVTTVPIVIGVSQPDILGTLSVGFLLDDEFASQLKQVTGSDVAFGMGGRILSSTLPHEARGALSASLGAPETPQNVTIGLEEYVVLPLRLANATSPSVPGDGPIALILRSRTDQLRFLQAIHTQLTVTAIVAVLLATLLSFAVARTITRPLAAITDVMREVATTGELTRKIVLRSGNRWTDEDARLLAATFNTLTDSVAKAQREMSQRERLSSLGRLSTVIAHEVRNPLMIIKAALHTLRQPDLTREALREIAADIDGEVDRLNRVVNEVLDFARPIRFDLAPASVNEVLRESAAAAGASPGAAIDVRIDSSVPSIQTDGERLRVALVNLIVNARHASEGSGTPVVVSTRLHEHTVSIVVQDSGTGIERADLSRVFDPYFTTKRGGTGLGLPIAKNIIEGLGGTITVTSELSRGTEIVIHLPLNRVRDRSVA
jgi:signal transduction histidine kinase